MVLHEKDLPYDLRPSTQDTKPNWLIEHYEGKMPALRHRSECYVDSQVIVQYLDFFFEDPPLSADDPKLMEDSQTLTDGIFPAIAKYLKHTPDRDEEDESLKSNLVNALTPLQHVLSDKTGPSLRRR